MEPGDTAGKSAAAPVSNYAVEQLWARGGGGQAVRACIKAFILGIPHVISSFCNGEHLWLQMCAVFKINTDFRRVVLAPVLIPRSRLWSVVHENEIRKLLLIPPRFPFVLGCKLLMYRVYLALWWSKLCVYVGHFTAGAWPGARKRAGVVCGLCHGLDTGAAFVTCKNSEDEPVWMDTVLALENWV